MGVLGIPEGSRNLAGFESWQYAAYGDRLRGAFRSRS
jgi:hypothetical protein